MRIIAYSSHIQSKKVLIKESTGEFVNSDKLDILFSFLCEPFQDTLRICWNLDETVAPIIQLLGEQKARRLFETTKLYLPPFKLFYIPEKIFLVKHIPSSATCILYNLSQYFPDLEGNQDLETTYQLGILLLSELKKMNIIPTKLTSPVAIYESSVMSKLNLPTWLDMPKEAFQLAKQCGNKLWIEAYQIGYWESGLYDYDIVSAFPSAATNLIDFRQCEWIQDKNYHKDAVYGYCRGIADISSKAQIHPIIHKTIFGTSITPVGIWPDYLNKNKIDLIREYSLGDFTITDGFWAIPKGKIINPLIGVMDKLFSYRANSILQNNLAKRMGTGLYGKFGEKKTEDIGDYVNPCWFAEISNDISSEVFKFIYNNKLQEDLVHVSVDGLLATENLELPNHNKPGSWKNNGETATLVLSSGLVYQFDKKPQGIGLQDILKLIREHPYQNVYKKKLNKRVTLGEAMLTSFSDLGKQKDVYTTINLISLQHDRFFRELPKNGYQLLNNKYKSEARRI